MLVYQRVYLGVQAARVINGYNHGILAREIEPLELRRLRPNPIRNTSTDWLKNWIGS